MKNQKLNAETPREDAEVAEEKSSLCASLRSLRLGVKILTFLLLLGGVPAARALTPVTYSSLYFTGQALTNPVTIEPYSETNSIIVSGTNFVIGARPLVLRPDTNGFAATNLVPNTYRVRIQGVSRPFYIAVPDTNVTVELRSIVTSGAGTYTHTYPGILKAGTNIVIQTNTPAPGVYTINSSASGGGGIATNLAAGTNTVLTTNGAGVISINVSNLAGSGTVTSVWLTNTDGFLSNSAAVSSSGALAVGIVTNAFGTYVTAIVTNTGTYASTASTNAYSSLAGNLTNKFVLATDGFATRLIVSNGLSVWGTNFVFRGGNTNPGHVLTFGTNGQIYGAAAAGGADGGIATNGGTGINNALTNLTSQNTTLTGPLVINQNGSQSVFHSGGASNTGFKLLEGNASSDGWRFEVSSSDHNLYVFTHGSLPDQGMVLKQDGGIYASSGGDLGAAGFPYSAAYFSVLGYPVTANSNLTVNGDARFNRGSFSPTVNVASNATLFVDIATGQNFLLTNGFADGRIILTNSANAGGIDGKQIMLSVYGGLAGGSYKLYAWATNRLLWGGSSTNHPATSTNLDVWSFVFTGTNLALGSGITNFPRVLP